MKNRNSQNGFTLIELAVVLVFSGMFVLVVGNFMKYYTEDQKRRATLESLEKTHEALFIYYERNGVYPCPADPTLQPDDANYGVQQCRDNADAAYDENACTVVPSAGISCTTAATRDSDGDTADDVVMMGAVPFSTLAQASFRGTYKEADGKDGYNTLLSYAISEKMTATSGEFNFDNPAPSEFGAITIIDENDISMTDPDGAAHYALYSHGENRRGGFSITGQQVDDCTVTLIDGSTGAPPPGGPALAPAGTDIEIENCDYNDGVFVKAIRSDTNGRLYSDDRLVYRVHISRPFWRASFANSDHIYNLNSQNVGIGTEAPTHKLHITGDVTAETSAEADSGFCDGPTDACIDPSFLGGVEVGTTTTAIGRNACPAGQVAYAIGDDPNNNTGANAYIGPEIICRQIEWASIANKQCAANHFLRGISNLGNLLCCTNPTSGAPSCYIQN